MNLSENQKPKRIRHQIKMKMRQKEIMLKKKKVNQMKILKILLTTKMTKKNAIHHLPQKKEL
jgi:hypothetical protein